MKNTQ